MPTCMYGEPKIGNTKPLIFKESALNKKEEKKAAPNCTWTWFKIQNRPAWGLILLSILFIGVSISSNGRFVELY